MKGQPWVHKSLTGQKIQMVEHKANTANSPTAVAQGEAFFRGQQTNAGQALVLPWGSRWTQ